MTRSELETWAQGVGLAIDPDGWQRLERLVALWQQYGRAMNLVGTTERDALLEHIQEGLQCVACVERVQPVDEACCWVDVGSGGGLPGLVVAAIRRCEMILIEPRERRAAFLELGLAAVGKGTGRMIRGRWSSSTWKQELSDKVNPRSRTPFFILSSRAVFSPQEWLRTATETPIPRGIILCHVDLDTTEVAGKKPREQVRGSRWSVLGFSTGEPKHDLDD